MKADPQVARLSKFLTFATFVLVVTVLKVAGDVFIPIALTVLLTFLLTPIVVRLMRWRVPRALAIILTVSVAFSVIVAVGWVMFSQTVALAKRLPDYEENIREKLTVFKGPQSNRSVSRMMDMLKAIQRDMTPDHAAPTHDPAAKPQPSPVPVEVRPHDPSPIELARQVAGPVLQPLGTAAIVIVFVVALLFQREDMRDRFIKVISAGRLNLATQALEDAAGRVNRYLSMQLVVNASYGVPAGVGLAIIGVPNALLWGILATLMRFIPFIGPWVAAAFPIALAAAVDPGWSMLLYTVSLFVTLELISNNIVEPWLYGASTGISNLALMIAAVFWTWLWGTSGLFLSTPLTVCIVVLGKHVPGLQFLSVLLGSEPVLDPAARFYQRMLSMDSDEMHSIARTTIEEKSLEEFYNDVFVPALFMSEQDRHSGTLAEVRQKFIFEASRELIEDLEREAEPGEVAEGKVGMDDRVGPRDRWIGDKVTSPVVLGLPARDDADEVVALMLQHLLRQKGIETEIVDAATRVDDVITWIKQHQIPITLVSALPPAALFSARQLCRRLRQQCPNTKLVAGIWGKTTNPADLRSRFRRPAPDVIACTLGDAVRQVEALLNPNQTPAKTEHPVAAEHMTEQGENFPEDHAVLPLKKDKFEPEEYFGAVLRDVARHFDVPISLVTIIATDPPFWKTKTGVAADVTSLQEPNGATYSANLEEIVLVADASKDKRFANDTTFTERGVRFYASAPLKTAQGRVVGCLTIVDTKPRSVTSHDEQLLETRATELMEACEAVGADDQNKGAL